MFATEGVNAMRSLERWSPLSGIVFVGLWIASFVVLVGGVNTAESDTEILAFFADKGNRTKEIILFFLLLGASLALVWFVSALRARFAHTELGAGTLPTLAFGSGVVACGLWIVSGGLWAVASDSIDESDHFVLDPNVYRLLGDLAFMVFGAGCTVALLFVLATSIAALRTQLLPRWLAWTGIAVGVLLPVAWTVVPFFAALVWVLTVSVALIRRPEPRSAAVPNPVAA